MAAQCSQLNYIPVVTCYHSFILIVSFCVLECQVWYTSWYTWSMVGCQRRRIY